MERADGLQVVLGASGGTGPGDRGRAGAPGPPGAGGGRGTMRTCRPAVEQVRADLYDPADAARAIAGAAVVYHAAQPPYASGPATSSGSTRRSRDAAAAAGARLVFADNLYMYGPGGSPMTEATPQRATDRKGALADPPGRGPARAPRARRARGRHRPVDATTSGRTAEHRGGGAGVRGDARGQGGGRGRLDRRAALVQLPAGPRPGHDRPGRPRRGRRARVAPAGHGPDDGPGVPRARVAVAGMPAGSAWTAR